jgi:GAF domain-containing protein
MEKLAQSGGGTIYVSVKILFTRVAAATILTGKHRWLWSYRSTPDALSAREAGKAFGVGLCGHVVVKNQPLVVTDLARDPRFAESPFLKQHRFRFYAVVPLPGPNAFGIQSGLLP